MTEPTQTIFDEEHVKEWLKERDVDLTGICSARDLIAQMPEAKPLLGNASTIIVVAKHTLKGVSWGRHIVTKQVAGARNVRFLEKICMRFACYLEDHGYPTLPLHALALDFEKRTGSDLLPAGQGSMLVRIVAVLSGLGTWGLNNMVPSKAYGPRIHLHAIVQGRRLWQEMSTLRTSPYR